MLIKELFDTFELKEYGFKFDPTWDDPNNITESFWNFCKNLNEENLHFEAMCIRLANAGKDDELLLQLFKLRETKKFDRVLEFLEASISDYLEMVD